MVTFITKSHSQTIPPHTAEEKTAI